MHYLPPPSLSLHGTPLRYNKFAWIGAEVYEHLKDMILFKYPFTCNIAPPPRHGTPSLCYNKLAWIGARRSSPHEPPYIQPLRPAMI